MHPRFLLLVFMLFWSAASAVDARAEGLVRGKYRFYYQTTSDGVSSAPIVHRYYILVHPSAKVDPRFDPRLRRAATIAQERANAYTKARCWRYVKKALLQAGAISSYPKSNYAYEAGEELVRAYGFRRLAIRDPYDAPIGAVIVYGPEGHGAGHVELRTRDGFASDYHSNRKCCYPLLAIYGKFTS